jgi:hypothetical protein
MHLVWLLIGVLTLQGGGRRADAQTTESVRLYGTYNVNRNVDYGDRARYPNQYTSSSSAYASTLNTSTANRDVIFWERTKDQLRNQFAINTDRYSPNWGSNDRVSTNERVSTNDRVSANYYDSRNPTYQRYPSGNYESPAYQDQRNQDYDNKRLFESKLPNFESGLSYQPPVSSISSSGATYDRDRGSQSAWDREKERERERERQRELERERNYYLNSRTRINSNPAQPNYGSQFPGTRLPGLCTHGSAN